MRKQDREIDGYGTEKPVVPIEEAMVAFTGTAISKKEMEKGKRKKA